MDTFWFQSNNPLQVRKEIYIQLKNFDRQAKEQRAVFCITYFPRGSRLSETSMGRLLTGGKPGAEETWVKAISLKHFYLPLIGQLFRKFYRLPKICLSFLKCQLQDN